MAISRRALAGGAAALALAPHASAQAVARGAAGDPRPRSYRLLGQAAPDFEFPKRGGGTAKLGDYRGKTLVLYFGGLWCPDCVLDGRHVNELARLASRTDNIAFLNIHTRNRFGRWGPGDPSVPVADQAQAEAALNRYFAETGYDYPIALDSSRTWARETYAIEWSPSYLIIDRAGVIRAWRTDLGENGARDLFAHARRIAAGRHS